MKKNLPVTNEQRRGFTTRDVMVLFAETLADERAKATGISRTPETDREVAETIAAHCFAKDITDRAREDKPLALEPVVGLDGEEFQR